MSKYAVIPAPGYRGDSAVVVGSYERLEVAKGQASKGYAVYETSRPKGSKMNAGELSVYQQGEDGVYRIPRA